MAPRRLSRNVVKQFSWEPCGKWRIHKKPRPQHIAACRPWLDVELAPIVLATVHPSSLLRAPDSDTRHRETGRFIDDLRIVARALSTKPSHSEKRP